MKPSTLRKKLPTIRKFLGKDYPKQDWMSDVVYDWFLLSKHAAENSRARFGDESKKRVLIAVKAQHPLVNGKPGPEYASRLEKAIEVYTKAIQNGLSPVILCFGGPHEGSETPLSKAGLNYLRSRNVGCEIREVTVYSGNDEDFQAMEAFVADESFRRIHICMSAGQLNRTLYCCYAYGYEPYCEVANYVGGHQNPICEANGSWSITRYNLEGPMALVGEAAKTAARHLAEAEE